MLSHQACRPRLALQERNSAIARLCEPARKKALRRGAAPLKFILAFLLRSVLEPSQELRTVGDMQLVAPGHCGAVGARVRAVPAVLHAACDGGRALQTHHKAVAAAQALVALLIARLPACQRECVSCGEQL